MKCLFHRFCTVSLLLLLTGCPADPPPIGIELPDSSTPDTQSDGTSSDAQSDATGPDGSQGDGTSDATVGCNSDDECQGAITLESCEIALCESGVCVASPDTKCCDTADDCSLLQFPETVSVCLELGCIDGTCTTYKVSEDCCDADDQCGHLESSCCDSAFCNEESVCELGTLTECCETSADCEDGSSGTNDVCVDACVIGGCLHKAPTCDVDKTYSQKTFDDGTLQLLQVFDDNPGDGVSWHVTSKASVSPSSSLRFGRSDCDFYYNGPVEDCVPTGSFADAGTPMSARVETSSFGVDPGVGIYLGFWVRMAAKEGFPAQGGAPAVDIDYLQVSVLQGATSKVVWRSTEAFGSENTTQGQWAFQTVNLSGYEGSMSISFEFVAYASNNFYATDGSILEGVYLDEIRVQATCQDAFCDSNSVPCASDGNGCTDDTCSLYANGSGGVCAYPLATPGAECQPCGQPGDCGDDACFDYACEDQQCSANLKDECCSPNSTFPSFTAPGETASEGFESGLLAGWIMDDPTPDDNVGWQTDLEGPFKGAYSLYFGDPSTHTYAAVDALGQAQPAVATAWTQGFSLPADSFRTPVISFWLNMSTEYNGSEGPGAEENYDTLSIWVERVATGETAEAWNSKSMGNTTNGSYQQVGVDLSDFTNDYIRIGLRFDSGDAPGTGSANDFGGVWIDEFGVHFVCGQEPCFGGSDCKDDDLCTTDICDLGVCDNVKEDPLCCTNTSDCADGNDCTIELCIDANCVVQYNPEMADDCCSEGPWAGGYTATFDSGLDGFEAQNDTPPIVWFSDSEGAYAGGGSAHFASPTTGYYSVTNATTSGTLTSPPILVPPYTHGASYAEFMLKMNTEWSEADNFISLFAYVDELSVRVKVDEQVLPTPLWLSHFTQNDTFGEWITTRVDLSDFAGQEIQLVIEFNTGDSNNNIFEGPRIDNFGFATTCKPDNQVQCIYGGDCSSGGDCTLASCGEDFTCGELPKATPQCCEPYVVEDLSAQFDGDEPAAGWQFETCEPGFAVPDDSVSWHVANASNAGGIGPKTLPGFLYFGNGVDYGGGSKKGSCGIATGPAVTLDADTPWTLSFWSYLDIEPTPACDPTIAPWADRFEVKLIDEETGNETDLMDKSDLACNQYGNWFPHSFDLTPFAGKTVRLRIEFTTWDNVDNDGKGLAFDAIEYEKGCPAP